MRTVLGLIVLSSATNVWAQQPSRMAIPSVVSGAPATSSITIEARSNDQVQLDDLLSSETGSSEMNPDGEAYLGSQPTHPGKRNQVSSQNEAYNIVRSAEGRLGVRVGDDVGHRVND